MLRQQIPVRPQPFQHALDIGVVVVEMRRDAQIVVAAGKDDPARGRLCDQSDLVEYRDAMTIVRDTIDDMIKRGMTLDQIKKADPVRAYRSRYGVDSGPWTTEMFITAVYTSLTAKKS